MKMPNLTYNFDQHKQQYDKIADFIISHCQKEMKTTFKLKEVMVPENNVIDRFEKLNA